jgi:hypothetical protein
MDVGPSLIQPTFPIQTDQSMITSMTEESPNSLCHVAVIDNCCWSFLADGAQAVLLEEQSFPVTNRNSVSLDSPASFFVRGAYVAPALSRTLGLVSFPTQNTVSWETPQKTGTLSRTARGLHRFDGRLVAPEFDTTRTGVGSDLLVHEPFLCEGN